MSSARRPYSLWSQPRQDNPSSLPSYCPVPFLQQDETKHGRTQQEAWDVTLLFRGTLHLWGSHSKTERHHPLSSSGPLLLSVSCLIFYLRDLIKYPLADESSRRWKRLKKKRMETLSSLLFRGSTTHPLRLKGGGKHQTHPLELCVLVV